jgi:hypothetical protein
MTSTDSPEPLRLTATVDVDYSQFYLVNWGSYFDPSFADENSLGLCDAASPGAVKFTAFRQYGAVPVAIEVHAAEPPELGAEWQDVVEVPFAASDRVVLCGWDPGSGTTEVPVSGAVRIRYAVGDGDGQRERYLAQFWPAPRSSAAVVVQESAVGQYWQFSTERADVAAAVSRLPESQRLETAIDLVLARHPATAQRLRSGDIRFAMGVSGAAYDVKPAAMSHDEFAALVVARAQG